ncbi:MAG TPA: HEAT repeat domain-containing protein, partial [Nitrolancea sp.]
VANTLFFTVIGPLLLADPAACDLDLLQRACALSIEPSSARYVLNLLAEHAATPPDVRSWATSALSGWFPLRPVWRRLFGGRGLRLLCMQNIADGQGDEMVRLVPLLHALFNDHPETRITLVTDRAYLYDHPRLELISFDEPGRIALALNEYFDGLLEFFEPHTPHLNHDTDLAAAIADYRERYAPLFDLLAATGWNRFTFDSVRINGFEWADALQLNECNGENVYDPALRLIAELGLPLRIGTQVHSESVLAHEPMLDRTWEHTSGDRSTRRPTALLNPFSDRDALKGSAPEKFDDLLLLIRALIEEHYGVVICPTGLPRGSRALVDDLRARLPEDLRQYTSIAPDPATSPSPSAAMRDTVSLVSQVDLVVTVEGWMEHAAHLNGKPCRLLLRPASGERDWQVWGRARDQDTWRFRGNPTLDVPPCPERPRRAAWLSLLNRINDPLWCDALRAIAGSPDHDIRRAALRALGRLGRSDLQPYFVALLDDPSWTIRSLAAEVLLERYPAAADGRPDRRTLEGYRAIGLVPFEGWEQVAHLESSALPAVRATLHDADPVMRREAAMILERYSRMLESPNGSGSIGATGMDGAPHEL